MKESKLRAKFALDKFISLARVSSLGGYFLDIGAGDLRDTVYIEKSGIFDRCFSIDSYLHATRDNHIHGDFLSYKFDKKFHGILASHVLEHTQDLGGFLRKIHSSLEEGGYFCIIVPPAKKHITTGHVTIWNGGLLLLNLVKSGFDCRKVCIKRYGYNVVLIGQKISCKANFGFSPNEPMNERYYLPEGLRWHKKRSNKVWYFNGDIKRLNW